MRSGKRFKWPRLLLALGLVTMVAACGNNVGGADICAAQRQYAVVCNTNYVDSTCLHDAACEFALYKDDLILTQHQCVLRNVAAMTCNMDSCDSLSQSEQVDSQTELLGPLASAFATSCFAKLSECDTTAATVDPAFCVPSSIYLDSVFAGLGACASAACDQYATCLDTVIAQNVGPGCLSVSFLATP